MASLAMNFDQELLPSHDLFLTVKHFICILLVHEFPFSLHSTSWKHLHSCFFYRLTVKYIYENKYPFYCFLSLTCDRWSWVKPASLVPPLIHMFFKLHEGEVTVSDDTDRDFMSNCWLEGVAQHHVTTAPHIVEQQCVQVGHFKNHKLQVYQNSCSAVWRLQGFSEEKEKLHRQNNTDSRQLILHKSTSSSFVSVFTKQNTPFLTVRWLLGFQGLFLTGNWIASSRSIKTQQRSPSSFHIFP